MTPRPADYNAADHIPASVAADAYLRPNFSSANRHRRFLWNIVYTLLFRYSPRPMHAWRASLLRAFGATIGPNARIYGKAKIWAPWNLICADLVAIADGAEIYNPSPVTLGSHAILSQDSYLCGATHDYDDPAFPLIAYSMTIGAYAWVCARASVAPGVNLGEGAVLGLGSVGTRDLEPWTIYAGVPAVKVKARNPRNAPTV